MREIKFRAWDKNQMWVTPIDTNYGLHRFFGAISEQAILMQYTGLKDKNGVEIYEGDIVEIENFEAGYILTTVKNTNGWLFELVANDGGTWNRRWRDIETLEVIGNIYQNPDLLTKTK